MAPRLPRRPFPGEMSAEVHRAGALQCCLGWLPAILDLQRKSTQCPRAMPAFTTTGPPAWHDIAFMCSILLCSSQEANLLDRLQTHRRRRHALVAAVHRRYRYQHLGISHSWSHPFDFRRGRLCGVLSGLLLQHAKHHYAMPLIYINAWIRLVALVQSKAAQTL